MKLSKRSGAALFGAILATAATYDAAHATLIDLGTLGGAVSSANAINDAGQVVGLSFLPGDAAAHAFRYSGGVMSDLGTLGGTESSGLAINNAGDVVGNADIAGDYEHAFRYSGGMMTDLGTLGGLRSEATHINELGVIAGSAQTSDGDWHAFVYVAGIMTDIAPAGTWYESSPVALNDAGQVLVYAYGPTGDYSFLYSGGVLTDLGSLGGTFTFGADMNASGKIVGLSYLADEITSHAFSYSGGTMTDLGGLGGTESQAGLINDAGQIVAASYKGSKVRFWFLDGGAATDIGSLGGVYNSPYAMNGAGQVAGEAETPGGLVHAYLYSGGMMNDLGTVNGLPTSAYAINESGQVTGDAFVSLDSIHAFLRNPECGDGILDVSEECDDANTAGGDCCASDCTYPGRALTCLEASKSALKLTNAADDAKDKLSWSWQAEEAVAQADLGSPATNTTYVLCVSDSTAGTDRLVASFVVPPGQAWTSKDPKGWSYRNKTGTGSGLSKIQVGTTAASGTTKVKIGGKGTNVVMPEPISGTELFDQDSRVTLQLFNSATSTCWSSEFTIVTKNTAGQFAAKTP